MCNDYRAAIEENAKKQFLIVVLKNDFNEEKPFIEMPLKRHYKSIKIDFKIKNSRYSNSWLMSHELATNFHSSDTLK